MTIQQLHQHGLDRRFGYKIRYKDGRESAFFRFDPQDDCWKTLLTKAPMYLSDANVKTVLEYEAKRTNTNIIIFACCCTKCSTPEARTASAELFNKMITVSHGYWPDHEAAENERIEREMAELK